MKKETLLEISIVVCIVCMVLLGAAIYRVNSVSGERDREFDRASRDSIVFNCKEIESVKASLRSVFARLTTFNLQAQTPAADLRARLYADFVHDYFSPSACPRKETP